MLCTSFAYVMEMFNVFHNDINVAHNVIHIVGNFWFMTFFKQLWMTSTTRECIPVGCVPPACWPYPSMHCTGGGLPGEGCLPRGGCLPRPRGVWQTPSFNRMTDRCKNITLPQRAVIMNDTDDIMNDKKGSNIMNDIEQLCILQTVYLLTMLCILKISTLNVKSSIAKCDSKCTYVAYMVQWFPYGTLSWSCREPAFFPSRWAM